MEEVVRGIEVSNLEDLFFSTVIFKDKPDLYIFIVLLIMVNAHIQDLSFTAKYRACFLE